MQTVYVEFNNMLTLFSGVMEEQPFRHQKNVMLMVSLEEYVKFIEMIIRTGKQWLYLPNDSYKKALGAAASTGLIKFLYFDIYRITLGELALSIRSGKECTVVSAWFDGREASQVSLDFAGALSRRYTKHVEAERKAYADLCSCLGGIPRLQGRNSKVYVYAILLRTSAVTPNPEEYELKEV